MQGNYRAKRKDNNVFVYGDLLQNVVALTGERRINGQITIDNRTKFTAIVSEEGCVHEVDEDTIGFRSGLFDKNKKAAFSGDIIYNSVYEEYGYIDFEEGQFVLIIDNIRFENIYNFIDELEIIGNIYDDRELLGEEE